MVIADIAYNKNHFTVFLIDIENTYHCVALFFRNVAYNIFSEIFFFIENLNQLHEVFSHLW